MDAVLQALKSTLALLLDARQGLEGETARLRAVNANLASTLRRLQARQREQQWGGTCQAPVRVVSGLQSVHQENMGQRLDPPASASAAEARHGMGLPAEFIQLQQLYVQLQGSACQEGSSTPSVTSHAAARFLDRLEVAYSPSSQHHACWGASQHTTSSQEGIVHCLEPHAFAEQSRYLGLVATVLSAVQVLTTPSNNVDNCLDAHRAQLASSVSALLLQCTQWQQDYRSGQHGVTAEGHMTQLYDEAVRWRNRALRTLTAAATSHSKAAKVAMAGATDAASSSAPPVSRTGPPGLWLPQCCWQGLAACTATAPNAGTAAGSDSQITSGRWSHPGLQLLPGAPRLNSNRAPSGVCCTSVAYQETSELVQHSRQLQKVQQLLLQLAVESQAAPRLLELLQQCCDLLGLQAAEGSAGPRLCRQPAHGVTHDRCCALYRLVYALSAGQVKQRGLGVGCQLAVEAVAGAEEGRG